MKLVSSTSKIDECLIQNPYTEFLEYPGGGWCRWEILRPATEQEALNFLLDKLEKGVLK